MCILILYEFSLESYDTLPLFSGCVAKYIRRERKRKKKRENKKKREKEKSEKLFTGFLQKFMYVRMHVHFIYTFICVFTPIQRGEGGRFFEY